MKADDRFLGQPKEFWAYVRTISQEIGYTERGTSSIKIPSIESVQKSFNCLGLNSDQIFKTATQTTEFGNQLFEYFRFRAKILNENVKLSLMNKNSAQVAFEALRKRLKPNCPLPMNKQKGEKRNHAFLTGIVNMLIESEVLNLPCDYDPRGLTTVTHESRPLRTLARRVDGAFPSLVDPIAIWEIKEYYYTTTFGSRVADGVYETLLDGMELDELEKSMGRKIQHVLFIDDYYTWWDCGRSYLCRMIDMLHMGYVDEIIFGKEVLIRLPELVQEWVALYKSH